VYNYAKNSGTFIAHAYNAKLPSPYVKEKGKDSLFLLFYLCFSTSLS